MTEHRILDRDDALAPLRELLGGGGGDGGGGHRGGGGGGDDGPGGGLPENFERLLRALSKTLDHGLGQLSDRTFNLVDKAFGGVLDLVGDLARENKALGERIDALERDLASLKGASNTAPREGAETRQ
jgi:hypothetical protein